MSGNGSMTVARRVNGDDDQFFPAPARASNAAMVDVAMTRAAQEVQAAMVIAKKFPRDQQNAHRQIMEACRRRTLADAAVYEYPRGKGEDGKKNFVTGPSIRLAEVLAQNWGNVDFGVVELEQRKGESTVMAYAWDLETNTRQTKIFTIKHERHTRSGKFDLTDPRDIYELTANQGARRLRACILGIIPGDIVDAAVAECEKTMSGQNAEPIADRVRVMLAAFADQDVTQAMVEAFVGHRADAITERELARLRKVYRSIKDNIAKPEDFFGTAPAPTASLNDAVTQAPSTTPTESKVSEETTGEKGEEGAMPPGPDLSTLAGFINAAAAIGEEIHKLERESTIIVAERWLLSKGAKGKDFRKLPDADKHEWLKAWAENRVDGETGKIKSE